MGAAGLLEGDSSPRCDCENCAEGTVEGGSGSENGERPILRSSRALQANLGANGGFVCWQPLLFLTFGIAGCFCLLNLPNFGRKIKASFS